MGEQDTVPVTVADDVYATLQRSKREGLQAELELMPVITAPLTAGQVIGMARWRSGDNIVQEVPLVAAKTVAEGGLIDQLVDKVLMLVDGLVKQVMAAIVG